MFALNETLKSRKCQRFIDLKSEATCETQMLGKRRKLVKSLLNLEAMRYTIAEVMPEADTIRYSSEYNDNFCNFTLPLSTENDDSCIKYPLYGGTIQTVYNQLIMEGALKSRSTIANINAPFRRNSTITMLLEDNLN